MLKYIENGGGKEKENEHRKEYLIEQITDIISRNIFGKNSFKGNIKLYLKEYEKLSGNDNFAEIYDNLKTREEKEGFIKYLELYRNSFSISENLISESRKTNKSIGDILFFGEKVEELLKRISILDEKIEKGEKIANSFEYSEFYHIYSELNDTDIINLSKVIKAEFGNIYDEYRKKYLIEKIIGNISANSRFNGNIKIYLQEYENLLEEDNFVEIYDNLKTREEKERFYKYLELYRNS